MDKRDESDTLFVTGRESDGHRPRDIEKEPFAPSRVEKRKLDKKHRLQFSETCSTYLRSSKRNFPTLKAFLMTPQHRRFAGCNIARDFQGICPIIGRDFGKKCLRQGLYTLGSEEVVY